MKKVIFCILILALTVPCFAKTISVNITDDEERALSYVMVDIEEWLTNAIKVRASRAKSEIVRIEIEKMKANPNVTSIPKNEDTIFDNAVFKTAAERNEEARTKYKN